MHHERLAGLPDDLGVRGCASGNYLGAPLEDRPGLICTVSGGGPAPPEMSPFRAFPIDLRVEQVNQWIEIAGHGRITRPLDFFGTNPSHR